MADLGSIARLLAHGGSTLAEAAREEARRVLGELVARGDLGRDEAAEIEAAVLEATEAHRRWLDERVVGSLRGVWRGVLDAVGRAGAGARPDDGALGERVAAIEDRLGRIERALAALTASRPPG